MKVACVNISDDILIGKTQDDNSSYLAQLLLNSGVTLSNIYVTPNVPGEIIKLFEVLNHNLVIFIGDNNTVKNFNIKNTLANYWNEDIVKNEHSEKFVKNYFASLNLPEDPQSKNEYFLPSKAIPLYNATSYLQGFMYDGGNSTFVFFPNDKESILYLFNNSLMPIIARQLKASYETVTINTFGMNEKDILKNLSDLIDNPYKITITTLSDGLDVKITLRYNALTPSEIINVFVSKIYEKLRKYIYGDVASLYQMALDLMTISNKSLAIAETITGGNIFSEFNKCSSPGKNLILEGRVTNTQFSQKNLLNINSNVINRYGAISVETAYEMATNLLEVSGADLVLATCGEIDGENNICYIAVGDSDGIHVYKNTYSGTKDKVINTVSKCAVFYLIKKLKQNDLFFNRITV